MYGDQSMFKLVQDQLKGEQSIKRNLECVLGIGKGDQNHAP